MKIVHVITRLIVGGAMENTLLTCEGLSDRGHDVTLITGPPLGPEGQLLDRALAGGYRVIVAQALRREVHPLRDQASYRSLLRYFAQLEPDVVHTHASKAGILGRRAAWRRHVPLVVHTIHGLPFHPFQPWWVNQLYIRLERTAARQCHALISVADAMTAQALAAGIGEPSQYTTIRSGMEVERFLKRPPAADAFRRSLNLPSGAVLFTQVARLAPLKGHEYILRAAPRLPEHIHLCFVGDGVLREALAAEVEAMGMQKRIHFTGLLTPDEIPAVMHASDAVLHCSLHEGLPRTLPQALLAGRPVITYDLDGGPEVVQDGQTGILLPPAEVAGLAEAIIRLADDPALRQRMGATGRQSVREAYAAQTMVEQIDALYTRLARQRDLLK